MKWVLVGRTNVGKSTLFNQLIKQKKAITSNDHGLTIDFHEGYFRLGDSDCYLIDTPGWLDGQMDEQAAAWRPSKQAIQEADGILLIVDGGAIATTEDSILAKYIAKYRDRVICCINKVDGLTVGSWADWYEFGWKHYFPISAQYGHGLGQVKTCMLDQVIHANPLKMPRDKGAKIAIIGRPNAGKSTLVNSILQEERMMVSPVSGTTRDAISTPFVWKNIPMTLIDTAGIRRKRPNTNIEKFSIQRSYQAVKQSDVVILVVDTITGIAEQEKKLVDYVQQLGRGLVIAMNKVDQASTNMIQANQMKIDREWSFLQGFPFEYISAQSRTGLTKLLQQCVNIDRRLKQSFNTANLTDILHKAIGRHQPPRLQGRQVKLRYAHLVSNKPLVLMIHGKQVEKLPKAYSRYLNQFYRNELNLTGIPLQIILKNDYNPYVK
jgi:GTP-binding protein